MTLKKNPVHSLPLLLAPEPVWTQITSETAHMLFPCMDDFEIFATLTENEIDGTEGSVRFFTEFGLKNAELSLVRVEGIRSSKNTDISFTWFVRTGMPISSLKYPV